jgi:lipopolysaccharide export system permease protein
VILFRMLFGQLVRISLAVLGVLTLLTVLMDFFEQARFLLSGKGSAGDVFLMILYRVPTWVHLLLPISMITGACIVFSLLGRTHQLRALAAAGISPFRLFLPVMGVAMLVCLAMVPLQELVVPKSLDGMENLIKSTFGRFDATWKFFKSHLWYQGDEDRLFHILYRSEDGKNMEYVTALELDSFDHVLRRTDVRSMLWEEGRWVGSGIEIRSFKNGQLVSYEEVDKKPLALSETPNRFRDYSGRPQQKPLGELGEAIREIGRLGLPVSEYRLAWHNRFAYPVIGLGLLLLIFPWLSVPWRNRTLSGALTESMALAFCGYILVAIFTAAVSGGLLAAPAGAWAPVIIVFLAAIPGWSKLVHGWRP